MVALALTTLMGYQSAAQAAYVETYFAFNNLGSEIGVLQMLSLTYQGAGGVETVVLPQLLPGWQGMPDNGATGDDERHEHSLRTRSSIGCPGGDGASTRLHSDLTLAINWERHDPLIRQSIISLLSTRTWGRTSTATMQTHVIGLILT